MREIAGKHEGNSRKAWGKYQESMGEIAGKQGGNSRKALGI